MTIPVSFLQGVRQRGRTASVEARSEQGGADVAPLLRYGEILEVQANGLYTGGVYDDAGNVGSAHTDCAVFPEADLAVGDQVWFVFFAGALAPLILVGSGGGGGCIDQFHLTGMIVE